MDKMERNGGRRAMEWFATLYNRLLGWISLALLCAGMTSHGIGNYISIHPNENIANAIIGAIALFAARRRKRYSTATAMVLGVAFLVWGITGMAGGWLPTGIADPLENAIRTVIGAWGVYVSTHDVLAWRRQQLAS